MEECFERLTPTWLNRAYLYNGSIGRPFHDFRYRLAQDEKSKTIHAAAYSKVCYEIAEDRVEQDFAWDEEGIGKLKVWLQKQYEMFLKKEGGVSN